MKSNNSIALEIFKNISLSKKEIDFIDSKFEKISLTKGDVLLCSDTQVTNQYYVFSGCLSSFFVNSLGKDHATQFAVKDWWISDYISFFTEEKSVMFVCL